jgi:tRNA A37 threonylcarbamoyladenosine biosynthesis protein TsaE
MIQTYRTPTGNVVHIDLYRCQSVAEVDLLDIPSLMDTGTIAFIEWIEQAEFIVPDILVSIHMDGELHRNIAIEWGAK